jgi:hypothetical protein
MAAHKIAIIDAKFRGFERQMSERLQRISLLGLWISTIAILMVMSVQGLSGNWITFFFVWPGGPQSQLGPEFTLAMAGLASYHSKMGYVMSGLAILILVLAFVRRSSVYVRVFAVLGFLITASAAMGGILYVSTAFQDRWSLGQMADSFVGAYAAYLLQLFFMNKTPRFPWMRSKSLGGV